MSKFLMGMWAGSSTALAFIIWALVDLGIYKLPCDFHLQAWNEWKGFVLVTGAITALTVYMKPWELFLALGVFLWESASSWWCRARAI